jgi:16S rRNA (guanine966-N2)-methyltransferase
MRIIAGSLKGRRLDTPDWEGLRPTSDKLRETLFNVLGPRVDGARVLDGYAGTGAVGIEALSRGAGHVTFVELDPRAAKLIAHNLQRCAVTERYAIIRARFADAATRLPAGTFDLVLLDPPYGRDQLPAALDAAAPLVAPDGLLILEHARRDDAPADVASLTKMRDILSGDSALSIYRAPASGARPPERSGAREAPASDGLRGLLGTKSPGHEGH